MGVGTYGIVLPKRPKNLPTSNTVSLLFGEGIKDPKLGFFGRLAVFDVFQDTIGVHFAVDDYMRAVCRFLKINTHDIIFICVHIANYILSGYIFVRISTEARHSFFVVNFRRNTTQMILH